MCRSHHHSLGTYQRLGDGITHFGHPPWTNKIISTVMPQTMRRYKAAHPSRSFILRLDSLVFPCSLSTDVTMQRFLAENLSCYHVATFLAIVFCVYSAVRRWRAHRLANPQGLPYPPGPKPFPIIGNMFDIARDNEFAAYQKLADKYGEAFIDFLPHRFLIPSARRFGVSQRSGKERTFCKFFRNCPRAVRKTLCKLFGSQRIAYEPRSVSPHLEPFFS